jgi:methionyl-tRNA formyltransferase
MGLTMNQTISLVFFGSGPVAAESLRLLASDFHIEAVITKPTTALEMETVCKDSPQYTVSNKQELDELFSTIKFESHVAILVDFGIIVSKGVINAFPYGIINSHFSLLPQWRGADPITFSILSGQRQTGVSIMLLVEGMDEGPLLAQETYHIPEHTTTPNLTKSLIELSAATLKKAIPAYLTGSLVAKPQEQASLLRGIKPSYSRKLTKKDGVIDWTKPADTIEREIRAFLEWPKSHTILAERSVIITDAVVDDTLNGKPGEIIATLKNLHICCGVGSLDIKRLKPSGKSEMSVEAFLAGYRQLL